MENCLFFGNGINRCFSNGSWSGLLEELANEYFVNYGMINSPTIAYESIYLSIISQNISVQDSEILQKIKDVTTLNNGYKKVYSKFLKLPIEYILTTNYDYAIECSSCNSFTDENYKRVYENFQEKNCSTYRHVILNGKRIFHIHGEFDFPKSIVLGTMQYANNLNAIISKLMPKLTEQDYKMYFNDEMLSNEITSRTWATYFFTKNIFIIGFGMDYSEIDIWWLIIYRASIIINKKAKINNKIYFYYCYEENSKNSSFMDCLRSMQIEVLERKITQTNNWEDTYIKMAEDIKRKILIK